MKSEGELAEDEYLQEQKEEPIIKIDIRQLLASKMLSEDEIFSYLKSKADGLNVIYHETIGIEKFKRDYYSSSLNRGFNNFRNIFFMLTR